MYRLFSSQDVLTQAQARHAFEAGFALLISRRAFSSEDEARESYPPKSGEEAIWKENVTPWFQERRHMYLACIEPGTSQLITSSAEPDKTHTPWTLSFCSDDMATTQLDARVCQFAEIWNKYDAAAVLLSKQDYPSEQIATVIRRFRFNVNNPVYSIDCKSGYDCQTATRDVLWAVNQTIDPKTLGLPDRTSVLAYHSESVHYCEPDQTVSTVSYK